MTDLTQEILTLLSPLDATLTADYPLEGYHLPVVTVMMRESAVAARADGESYLEEMTFGIEVYAGTRNEAVSLLRDADALLAAYGLTRTGFQFTFDQLSRVYRALANYRGVLRGDVIYQ